MPEESSDQPRPDAPRVQLFTDGACKGNPGPGGWGFILKHPQSGAEKEASGGEQLTTNNRMELLGVISGLESLTSRSRVEVVTDSTYVAKGATEWRHNWKKNGWQRREKGKLKPVKNDDLWKRLDDLLGRHEVTFTIVKGHSGHAENERCDQLAVAAAESFR